MIKVEYVGIREAAEDIEGLAIRLTSDVFWAPVLGSAIAEARRYAMSISPVDTGAYKGSHIAEVEGVMATLKIDPLARNPRSGVLVTRYAGAVEEHHHIYERTAREILPRLAIDAAQVLMLMREM